MLREILIRDFLFRALFIRASLHPDLVALASHVTRNHDARCPATSHHDSCLRGSRLLLWEITRIHMQTKPRARIRYGTKNEPMTYSHVQRHHDSR